MSLDQSFPRELLNQPSSARLAYFRALTIGHPLLLQVYDDLRLAIRDSAPGSIIIVQGPAGVGKTTLLQRVEKDLTERLMPEMAQDVERLPVVRIDAIAPESGSFNWKDYFRRLLIALHEPESLIDRKVIPNQSGAASQSGILELIPYESAVSSRLRYAVEQTLRRRRPLAVLVDDAQHMAIRGSGRKLLDQINTIKSIANVSRITHVLTGTYELMMPRHLKRRALSVTQCARMLAEAVDGERKLTESPDAKQQLRKNLGLKVEMKARQLSNDTSLDVAAPEVVAKTKRRRAGQRNPARDEIGAKRA